MSSKPTWRLSGEHGTLTWDGRQPTAAETPDGPDPDPNPPAESARTPAEPAKGIAGSLAEFVHALRTGAVPMGEVHDNIMSLAMVTGALEATLTDRRVRIGQLIDTALTDAIASAEGPERDRLRSWPRRSVPPLPTPHSPPT